MDSWQILACALPGGTPEAVAPLHTFEKQVLIPPLVLLPSLGLVSKARYRDGKPPAILPDPPDSTTNARVLVRHLPGDSGKFQKRLVGIFFFFFFFIPTQHLAPPQSFQWPNMTERSGVTASGNGSLLRPGAELAVLHSTPGRRLPIAPEINAAIVSDFFFFHAAKYPWPIWFSSLLLTQSHFILLSRRLGDEERSREVASLCLLLSGKPT